MKEREWESMEETSPENAKNAMHGFLGGPKNVPDAVRLCMMMIKLHKKRGMLTRIIQKRK